MVAVLVLEYLPSVYLQGPIISDDVRRSIPIKKQIKHNKRQVETIFENAGGDTSDIFLR